MNTNKCILHVPSATLLYLFIYFYEDIIRHNDESQKKGHRQENDIR